MEKKMVMQTIVNRCKSPTDLGIKYYQMLATLNDIPLTDMEAKLMAFMALNGSISSGGAKEAFSAMYGSPKASIGNTVWHLRKKGMLVKEGKRITLHPQLIIDFNNILVLKITMRHG